MAKCKYLGTTTLEHLLKKSDPCTYTYLYIRGYKHRMIRRCFIANSNTLSGVAINHGIFLKG